MKKIHLRPYVRAGITAFIVILISTMAYFMMFHIQANHTAKVIFFIICD